MCGTYSFTSLSLSHSQHESNQALKMRDQSVSQCGLNCEISKGIYDITLSKKSASPRRALFQLFTHVRSVQLITKLSVVISRSNTANYSNLCPGCYITEVKQV